MPKDKDPNLQDNSYKPSLRPEFYLPYPTDSNDKPFMSYEALSKGANGAYPKGQK
jgi:hypothetical protein